MEEKQVQAPQAVAEKEGAVEEKQAPETEQTFIVETKGFLETFTDRSQAKQKFEKLKKSAIRSKQPAKVSLSVRHAGSNQATVQEEFKVGKDFYEED